MYESLKGKRVVITGGSSGIGHAIARRFVAEGARVVICGLQPDHIQQVTDDVPGLVAGLKFDVADHQQVKEAFVQVDALLGGIDVLIANAGISVRKNFLDLEPEQWQRVLAVNLDGIYYCAKEAAVRMSAQQSGVILFTASTNGMEGHPYYTDYNASKAAVILLMKTMALELAPHIRVNAVSPGYVLTPMQLAEYSEEMLAKVNAGIPLQRHADPAEVAALFAFLASDQASFISGANIPIDGAETAGKF